VQNAGILLFLALTRKSARRPVGLASPQAARKLFAFGAQAPRGLTRKRARRPVGLASPQAARNISAPESVTPPLPYPAAM
jgi:hypothetical protein